MKQKLLFVLLAGAVFGAVCGFIEAAVWLARSAWWFAEAQSIAVGMLLYAALNALLTGLWGLCAASRMDTRTFQRRALLFSLSAMGFVFGGYYVNWLYFPKLKSLPSLAFTGSWTVAWLAIAARLLRKRPASSEAHRAGGLAFRPLGLAALGLVAVAGVSLVLPQVSRRTHQPTAGPAPSSRAAHPNVLLIVMDTVRADHLSCYGYGRPTSPNLARMAQDGVVFEQAWTTAPWTLPSHASLFTGFYVSQHQVERGHRRLDDRFETLAELLRDQGYQTAGFSNNAWVSRATNFDQGFGYFEDFKGSWGAWKTISVLAAMQIKDRIWKPLIHGVRPGAATRTNQAVRHWLDRILDPAQPFFIFINYLDAHFPYLPPEPYRSRFLQPENQARGLELIANRKLQEALDMVPPPVDFDAATREMLSDLYDGQVASLDAHIGELVDELRRRGLLDSTIVIVTSDHGENLGAKGFFEHRFGLYQSVLHIPLIMRYPKALPKGARFAEPVSLVDVMPTILELAELEAPMLAAHGGGINLVGSGVSVPKDRLLLAEYGAPLDLLIRFKQHNDKPFDEQHFTRDIKSIRRGSLKFIWASDGQHELYDVSQDPQEETDLLRALPEQAKAMEESLQQLLTVRQPVGTPEAAPELDDATRAQLRALGYLQ